MKVRELMNILRKLDPDMRVMVNGFEAGYDDVGYCGVEEMALDIYDDEMHGRHERSELLENAHEFENETVFLISHDAPFTIEYIEEPINDNAEN